MFRLELDDNQKIVFFELLSNLLDGNITFDAAEEKLVADIVASLEKQLDEPFSPEYEDILLRAKESILSSS